MAVHCVYISSKVLDGMALDTLLRQRFREVYRVGVDFWLVDAHGDAEAVVERVRPHLTPVDKMFVGALTRDVVPVLSRAAHEWLNAPGRGWRATVAGCGEPAASHSLLPPLADDPFARPARNPFSAVA